VPASLIQHKDRVHTGLKLPREVLQKDRHRIGTHPRQRQGESVIRAGPAGGKQIQALEALIDDTRWTLAALVPDAGGSSLLAKACLVLAPELKTRIRVRRREALQL
jgi:hypothetical protein